MREEKPRRGKIVSILNRIFIDGLAGMALGLFATLIVGTILDTIGSLLPESVGRWLSMIAGLCKAFTGAGIGVGVAYKLKESPLVTLSCAAVGMIGAFASKLLAATAWEPGVVTLAGPGEPLGAFVAVIAAIECGRLIVGKTKLDILLVPVFSILPGAAVGLLVGPPISKMMTALGEFINWGTQCQPILMGVIVSAVIGVCLTLPISSAALGIILGLNGIAAGAATVGCCANMIGFATASFRENKVNGLLAQGLGTSMLQIGNIVKNPLIWLPAIITSAVLGPVSTMVLHMTNNATGSGMGTAGLVGQINAYQTMVSEGVSPVIVLLEIAVMHFLLPGIMAFGISEFMRKKGLICEGSMKLSV